MVLAIQYRAPHASGDGPTDAALWAQVREFSPHMWGWSELAADIAVGQVVLPTYVGMVRP